MSGLGDSIEDRFWRHQQRKHMNVIKGKIPEIRDKQIYRSMTSDLIDSDSAVRQLQSDIGVKDPNEIVESLNRLIEKNHIVSSTAYKTKKVYLQKNIYKPL